jgi:hypothetical protein
MADPRGEGNMIRNNAAFHRRSFLGILGGAGVALGGGNPNAQVLPRVPTPMPGTPYPTPRDIGECASNYNHIDYVRHRIDSIDGDRERLQRKSQLRLTHMEADLTAMRSLSPTVRARLLADRRNAMHRQYTLDEVLSELNPQERAKLLAEEKIAAFFRTSFLNE